jgi:hypothetical protein
MRRLVSGVLLVLFPATSCTSWSPVRGPVPEAFSKEGKPPGTIRLRLISNERWTLNQPHLVSDSIVGVQAYTETRRAFAVADVSAVEIKHVDGVKTALAILGVVGMAAAVAGSIALSSADWWGNGSILVVAGNSTPVVASPRASRRRTQDFTLVRPTRSRWEPRR